MKRWLIIHLIGLLAIAGCKKDMPAFEDDTPFYLDLPSFAPEIPVPKDNKLTTQRVKLGKKLFFDKRLSRDLTLSCATCHRPERAFADNKTKAIGIANKTGLRNVPTVMNIAYAPLFNWDGGAKSLRAQALVPIQSHKEMDMTLDSIILRLGVDEAYAQLSREAYESELSRLVVVKALAAYERTITTFNSPFDDFYYRGKSPLSARAQHGFALFMSKRTSCSSCHTPPLFTNHQFANVGLSKVYADSGRGRITFREDDLGKFKVPTLRNVAITGPYMHDGSMESLKEVVQHFNEGGQSHVNKSKTIKPLNLTPFEQKALIEFLKSLTDYRFQKVQE